jgi:hypothetical protein
LRKKDEEAYNCIAFVCNITIPGQSNIIFLSTRVQKLSITAFLNEKPKMTTKIEQDILDVN